MNTTLLLFFNWLMFIFNAVGLVIFSIVAMRNKMRIEQLHIRHKQVGTNTSAGQGIAALKNLHNDTRVTALISSILFAAGAISAAVALVYLNHIK